MNKLKIITQINDRLSLLQAAVTQLDTLTTTGLTFACNHAIKVLLREQIVFLLDLSRDIEECTTPIGAPRSRHPDPSVACRAVR